MCYAGPRTMFTRKEMGLSNSNIIAGFMPIFQPNEDAGSISKSVGVPIGFSERYSSLFRLDLNAPENPHVSIIGMTGSGKTHLIKTIISGTALLSEEVQIIIDWNGEYVELSLELGGLVIDFALTDRLKRTMIENPSYKITCFNLSNLDESNRRKIASEILKQTLIYSKSKGFSKKVETLIFVDEAWKLLDSESITAIFREARKYGLSIIAASQMLRDISNEIVANSATLFVFRLQNPVDFDALKSLNIFEKIGIDRIKDFGVGECAVLASPRSGLKCEVVLKVLDLTNLKTYYIHASGVDKLVSEKSIKRISGRLGISESMVSEAIAMSVKGRRIDAAKMSASLLKSGVELAGVITLMRLIGVRDIDMSKIISGLYNCSNR